MSEETINVRVEFKGEMAKKFDIVKKHLSFFGCFRGITPCIATYTEIRFTPLVLRTQEYWPLATVVLFFYLALGLSVAMCSVTT